jgi:amino acid transporter
MVGLLISMFVGVVLVAHFDGAAPGGDQTVLSQIAHRSVGGGIPYGFVQVATTLVLLVAANSAFNGFPRLPYFMARDGFAPVCSCAWEIASRSPTASSCSPSRRG